MTRIWLTIKIDVVRCRFDDGDKKKKKNLSANTITVLFFLSSDWFDCGAFRTGKIQLAPGRRHSYIKKQYFMGGQRLKDLNGGTVKRERECGSLLILSANEVWFNFLLPIQKRINAIISGETV